MFQTFFLQFEFEEDNKNEHLKLFVEEKKNYLYYYNWKQFSNEKHLSLYVAA